MNPTNHALKFLIILYIVIIIALSVTLISRKIALHKTWVLRVRLDHILHILLFIPWVILLVPHWRQKKGVKYFFSILAAGMLLAVVSEVVQYFLHYRSFNLKDMLSNCLGVVIGGMVAWRIWLGQVINMPLHKVGAGSEFEDFDQM